MLAFDSNDEGSTPSSPVERKDVVMDSMLSRQWKTINDEKVENVVDVIKATIENSDREIHVGTDSQQAGKFTEYVTIIVLVEKGKGGRAFYMRERVPRITSLRERLLKEVWMSVNTGLELSTKIADTTDMTIHVDANPNLKFKSSSYVKELTSMVVGQGFKTLLKPDSWAASHIADHVVKHNIIGR